jgi:pimeloyl-ACP methyl ester carboxylesterase
MPNGRVRSNRDPPMSLSPAVEAWRARGTMVRARNMNVFVIDEGSGPPLLALHGFPTSSYDFARVWPHLVQRHRLITFDFPGFGFSDKPSDFSYSLFEQADIVEIILRDRGIEKTSVWAHDMGTSVATELLSRREAGLLHFEIDRLILMNGSVHAEMASLTAAQRVLRRPILGPLFARAANLRTYKLQLKRILARAIDDAEIEDQFSLLRLADGHRNLPSIIHYYDERIRFRRRWIGALETFDRPSLILWGTQDPVAVPEIAELLARETPNALLRRLEGVGHYPQLEAPDEVVAALDAFLPG